MNLTRLVTRSLPLLAVASAAVGQPLNEPTKGMPRIENGKPEVAESVPWKPAGEPDLSGKQLANAQNAKLSVTVYVETGIGDSTLASICMQALGVATRMFAWAGVRIDWRTGQPKAHGPEWPILVHLSSNTPETFRRGALAYAYVFEGVHIRIFYDRVRNPDNPRATAMLLAHVLVHEITHILEGVDRHSKEGVMKARWTEDDLVQMVYKPLPFDPADLLLIRKGLAYRGQAARSVPLGRFPQLDRPITDHLELRSQRRIRPFRRLEGKPSE